MDSDPRLVVFFIILSTNPKMLQMMNILVIRAEQRKKRKADGPLYLETAGSTLRETSHLTSAPSSDCPTKIAASNTTVFLKNEPVKK